MMMHSTNEATENMTHYFFNCRRRRKV